MTLRTATRRPRRVARRGARAGTYDGIRNIPHPNVRRQLVRRRRQSRVRERVREERRIDRQAAAVILLHRDVGKPDRSIVAPEEAPAPQASHPRTRHENA